MTKPQYRDFVKLLFKKIAIHRAIKLLHYNLKGCSCISKKGNKECLKILDILILLHS